jgi:hypothetical protein
MRTTLTLDDDLARLLERRARESSLPFKTVVNNTLRRGLAAEARSSAAAPLRPFKVQARNLGLRPGIDPQKLNQIADELEAESLIAKSKHRP